MNKFVAYVKLLRLPGLGGLALPPIFGAISVGMYNLPELSILFFIGCCAAVFGFVLNDYADVKLDKLITELHGKPLVSGDIDTKHAVTICLFCILITLPLVFLLWYDTVLAERHFASLLSLTIAYALGGIIYNIYGKKIAGSDFLIAFGMALLVLFGALAFSDPTLLTWIIFLLTFNQTLHMNSVEGGIKDADHDYMMGVVNLASVSGVKVADNTIFIPWSFKLYGLGIRLFSSILIFIPFVNGLRYEYWQLGILVVLIAIILHIELKLLFIHQFDRTVLRKLIASAAFIRYTIVPVMLISKIDFYAVILIFFPLIWYIAFTPLARIKAFQPEM